MHFESLFYKVVPYRKIILQFYYWFSSHLMKANLFSELFEGKESEREKKNTPHSNVSKSGMQDQQDSALMKKKD